MSETPTLELREALDRVINQRENIPQYALNEAMIVIYEALQHMAKSVAYKRTGGYTYKRANAEEAVSAAFLKLSEVGSKKEVDADTPTKGYTKRTEAEARGYLRAILRNAYTDIERKYLALTKVTPSADTEQDAQGPTWKSRFKDLTSQSNDGTLSHDEAIQEMSGNARVITDEAKMKIQQIFTHYHQAQDSYLAAIQDARADRLQRDTEGISCDRHELRERLGEEDLSWYETQLRAHPSEGTWSPKERDTEQNRLEKRVSRYRAAFESYLTMMPPPDLPENCIEDALFLLEKLRPTKDKEK